MFVKYHYLLKLYKQQFKRTDLNKLRVYSGKSNQYQLHTYRVMYDIYLANIVLCHASTTPSRFCKLHKISIQTRHKSFHNTLNVKSLHIRHIFQDTNLGN